MAVRFGDFFVQRGAILILLRDQATNGGTILERQGAGIADGDVTVLGKADRTGLVRGLQLGIARLHGIGDGGNPGVLTSKFTCAHGVVSGHHRDGTSVMSLLRAACFTALPSA